MKKLVLMLVLAMACAPAWGSYYLTVNGQDVESAYVPIGGTATIGIWSTDTNVVLDPTSHDEYGLYHGMSLVSWTTAYGDLGGFSGRVATDIAGYRNSSYDGDGSPSVHNGWTGDYYEDPENPGTWLHNPPTEGLPTEAGKWFEYTFTNLQGEGQLALLTWGPGWTTTVGNWDSVAITAVPEPATLAILGLGALAFLRKRS